MNADALPALKDARVVAPSRPAGTAVHCATYLLDTLEVLGIDRTLDDRPLCLTPTPSDEVLVHPGSGSVAKNWPAEHFAEVIDLITGPVRLIVGEADERAARAVEACLG